MYVLPFVGGKLMATPGQYEAVILAAQRAVQLMKGRKPRVDTKNLKPSSVAVEEVLAGKITYHEAQSQPEEETRDEGAGGGREGEKKGVFR